MISQMKFFHSFIVLENSSNKGMRDNVGTLRPQQCELTTLLPRMRVRLSHPQMTATNILLPKHISTGKNRGPHQYRELVSENIATNIV